MLNFDAEKLVKGAKEGLEKAEKLGGQPGEAAKGILKGLKNAEKAPEQVIEVLRSLIAEAKKLAGASGTKNEKLEECIRKAEALLEGGDISAESVAKLTAELKTLMKGAPAEAPNSGTASKPMERKPAETSGATEEKAVEFSDVDPGAYYYDAVQWAVKKGITSGTTETTFSPDQTCTRAQTITFLWRAAGSPAPGGKENPFSDVKEGTPFYNAILWAAGRGIISGSSFNPSDAVTRAQAAAFLYRNAGSPAVQGGASFSDVPADAYYAKAVAWAAKEGVTSGTKDNTFRPDAACTRGQIVTFLYRAKK